MPQTQAQIDYGKRRTAKRQHTAGRLVDDNITHLFLPDTQTKPGVCVDHLAWANQYIRARYEGKALTLVHLGDHWDFPSLSSYDRGKGSMEGRRYVNDVAAGNEAFALLNEGLDWPGLRKVFLFGNHEDRVSRAIESDVQLDGILSLDQCNTQGWERHEFREPVNIDGVVYAHFFYHPSTGRPYGGENVELRLKTIGHSFVMGHQQGLKIGMRYVGGRQHVGIVAGSFYMHNEDYLGPQANAHWRGLVVANNVVAGSFDPMPVGLDYLCKRFAGHPLAAHKPELVL